MPHWDSIVRRFSNWNVWRVCVLRVRGAGCGVRGHSNVWLASIWCMLLGHVCLLLTNGFHECNGREKGPLLGQKKGQPATINAYQGSRHVATAGQKPNTHTFPFCLYKCFSKLFLSHFICLVYVSIKSFNPSFGWTERYIEDMLMRIRAESIGFCVVFIAVWATDSGECMCAFGICTAILMMEKEDVFIPGCVLVNHFQIQ